MTSDDPCTALCPALPQPSVLLCPGPLLRALMEGSCHMGGTSGARLGQENKQELPQIRSVIPADTRGMLDPRGEQAVEGRLQPRRSNQGCLGLQQQSPREARAGNPSIPSTAALHCHKSRLSCSPSQHTAHSSGPQDLPSLCLCPITPQPCQHAWIPSSSASTTSCFTLCFQKMQGKGFTVQMWASERLCLSRC